MRVAAFRYAESGQPSSIQILTKGVERYGAYAMLGRQLHYREILRMNVFRNIVTAYTERARSKDFAKWAQDNPTDAEILANAEVLASKDA